MKNCPHCHKEISDLLKIFFPWIFLIFSKIHLWKNLILE
jgi:hypothetical protein